MFVFRQSLITLTILVIGISVRPAISPRPPISSGSSSSHYSSEKQNYCETLLTNYCGFKNNITDYIVFNFNASNYSQDEAEITRYLVEILQALSIPLPQTPIQVGRLINKLAVQYLDYIITDVISDRLRKELRTIFNSLITHTNKPQKLSVALLEFIRLHVPEYSYIVTAFQDFQSQYQYTRNGTDISQLYATIQEFMNQNLVFLYVFYRQGAGGDVRRRQNHGKFKYLREYPLQYFCKAMFKKNDVSFFTNLLT